MGCGESSVSATSDVSRSVIKTMCESPGAEGQGHMKKTSVSSHKTWPIGRAGWDPPSPNSYDIVYPLPDGSTECRSFGGSLAAN
ncbi:hypothetical protein RRG08_039071 [Elysia crispata]|uniref:Uncharacterized protein n=1 Tax=Elysia crispata TaxID=231223 RepID=A0AAE0YHX2_9GAST|nr:hypothetical protein RRG08_039071 [Elysia crispata]